MSHAQQRVAATRARDFWPVPLFTLLTWVVAGLLLALQPMLPLDPGLLMLPQFGPAVAAVVVTVLLRRGRRPAAGPASMRWLRPTRDVLVRCVTGAGLVVAVLGLSLGVLALAGRPVHLTDAGQLAGPWWLLVVLQWVGACGEELGWRVFLQRRLEAGRSPVAAAVVVGVLWGAWHVQYLRFGAAFMTAFMVMTVAVSVILAVLVSGAGTGTLLVAGTLHCLINLGTLGVLDIEGGDVAGMTALAGCSTAVAVALAVAGHRVRRTEAVR
ncbi:CPBP family intramembrane glutamic endopeptidase [Kitasatospora sp. NPDC092286]|uniref:CPBP family intramembrane glutamic endopeptidase n=1 Tax=Kitasatospora sp. NPDC092286 TaxID=3364087 RepID=UPI003815EEEA